MRLLAWFSLAFLVAAYLSRPLADPDLWWHTAVGRWIVSHRAVPHVDYWNMFGVGQPWRAYSWSNELVYALVDGRWSEQGLFVLQVIIGMLLTVVLQYVCGRLAGNYYVGALIGAYAALATHAHFSLRPQTFVWVLYALCLYVADASARASSSRRHFVIATVLGCLWANSHLSAVIGAVALGFWSVQADWGAPLWRRAAVLVAWFLVGTFLSPYHGGEWLTFFEKSDHIMRFRGIDEFGPATILHHSTGCILLQMTFLGILCFSSRLLPPTSMVLLALGTTLGGFAVAKFLPFSAITWSALLAVWYRKYSERSVHDRISGNLLGGFSVCERLLRGLQPNTVGAIGFLMCATAWVLTVRGVRHPVDDVVTPRSSVKFINDQKLGQPILGEMGTGGYLMYHFTVPSGDPQYLVPIDGRTNVNSPGVWRSLQKALRGVEGWKEYVELVHPQVVLWRQNSPLVALLLESPEWCRVFQSGRSSRDFSVFITREAFQDRRASLQSTDCQWIEGE